MILGVLSEVLIIQTTYSSYSYYLQHRQSAAFVQSCRVSWCRYYKILYYGYYAMSDI